MSNVLITGPERTACDVTILLPESKSLAARALMASAYAGEAIPEPSVKDCGDVAALKGALGALQNGARRTDIGSSGTAMRFIIPYIAATARESVELWGSEQVKRRPVGVIVDTMRLLGADIEYAGAEGHLPLLIGPARLHGGSVRLDMTESSQYASALMLCAPTLPGGIRCDFDGKPVSRPYLEMTEAVMRRCGIDVALSREGFRVRGGKYDVPSGLNMERDWSAATFWLEAASLLPAGIRLHLPGLTAPEMSCQGDARYAGLFRRLGVITISGEEGVIIEKEKETRLPEKAELNLADYPDGAPAAACALCAAGVPFRLSGLSHLVVKESDRLERISNILRQFGYSVTADGESLRWDVVRLPAPQRVIADPKADHRIAMAFAIMATPERSVQLCDAECVAKSYPGFWDELEKLGYRVK